MSEFKPSPTIETNIENHELPPELLKLKKLTAEMAQHYREMGIPVTDNGRIDMNAYTKQYTP